MNNSGSQINFSGKQKGLTKQGAGNYEQKSQSRHGVRGDGSTQDINGQQELAYDYDEQQQQMM